MGDWDFHCCFCGGPFHASAALDEEENNEAGGYSPELISRDDLAWLDVLRAIGFNPKSFTVDKCFITGEGEAGDYGYVDCDRGEDPNVPTGQNNPDRIQFAVYSEYDPDAPFAAPFHPQCFQVFLQALRYQLFGEWLGVSKDEGFLDKSVLYTVVSSLHKVYHHCLQIDYYELNDAIQEQYWCCFPGQEAWVVNPFDSEAFLHFWQRLEDDSALTETHITSTNTAKSLSVHSRSPFTELADEVVLEILLSLPYKDIRSFLRTGLTAIPLQQAQGFWKRKLAIDMPFLWDFPEFKGIKNFFSIYLELQRQCFATTPSIGSDDRGLIRVEGPRDKSLVLGLANRRRVWNSCSQIAKLYAKEKKVQEEGSDAHNVAEEIVQNSVSLHMPHVAFPVLKEAHPVSTYLISSWADLDRKHVLNFYYDDDSSRLCGIEVETVGGEGSRLLGVESMTKRIMVEILPGDWITSLELEMGNCDSLDQDIEIGITDVQVCLHSGKNQQVNKSDTGKRRMAAVDGMCITGAVAEIAGGVIQRLGLLQCPRELGLPTTPASCTQTDIRLASERTVDIPQLEKCLWKESIPPKGLSASTYNTGYWTPARSLDTIPMEALIFGTSDSELSQITGFSSDPDKTSFAVHYLNGSSKVIGTRNEATENKLFEIDGAGGERITRVEIGMNALPMAIKMTTNRGRHCFYGQPQKNAHTAYEPTEGCFIAGIYVSWGYGSGNKRRCTTISILSGSISGGESAEVNGAPHRNVWNPPRPADARPNYHADNIAVTVDGYCGPSCIDHW